MAQHGVVAVVVALLLLCTACSRQAAAKPDIAASLDLDQSFTTYTSVIQTQDLLRGAKTYQKLMAYKHSLTRGQLQRSLVYKGANVRLRKVVDKLLAGRNVSVGVIGGSISWGHMVQKGVEDWFSVLSSYIDTTFNKAKLTYKNGCVPATQSEYVSVCLNKFVDSDVDLVFVEYATNDGYIDGSINNSVVQAFERMIRKLLKFKNAPAVVLMEFLATDMKQNNVPFYATAEDQYGVLAQYYGLPWLSFRNMAWHGFWSDKPGLSRNDVFYLEDERHPTPLGHRYMADMAVNLIQQTYVDSLLAPLGSDQLQEYALKVPSPVFAGNYESGNLVCIIGDDFPSVVVEKAHWEWINEGTAAKPKRGFVSWKAGAKLVLKIDTRASSDGGNAVKSSNISLGTGGEGSSTFGAAGSGSLARKSSKPAGKSSKPAGNRSKVAGNTSNLAGNSSNLARNSSNLAGKSSQLARKSSNLARNSSKIAAKSSKFAENHSNLAGAGKSSIVAAKSSKHAEKSIKPAGNGRNLAGSSSKHAGAGDPASAQSIAGLAAATALRDMIVWIGYLKSWRYMGSATISCIGGCECSSTFVDGMHEEGNTQQYMARLFATQHEHCLVEVKINEFSRSHDHKFKVTGVMVTRRIDYLGEGDFTDQVLMDAMAPQNEATD